MAKRATKKRARKRAAKKLKKLKKPKQPKKQSKPDQRRKAGRSKVANKPLAKKTRARVSERTARAATAATATTEFETVDVAEQDALRAKFELAPPAWTKELDDLDRTQTIPWGYGRDKVVAMAIDPERLFVYWEVTDEAIARARASLGPAGDDTWLDLRVHDVTGILFDGGNSHHFFDLGVARADRQWFVQVGRPSSTVVVELGLLARSGAFAKIARSHRVDFPRREPAPPGPVEWLTVRPVPSAHGNAGLTLEPATPRSSDREGGGWGGGSREGREGRDGRAAREMGEFGAARESSDDFESKEISFEGGEWRQLAGEALGGDFWNETWVLLPDGWEWQGPTFESRWESGPHSFDVASPIETVAFESHEPGMTVQTSRGVTRVRLAGTRVEIRGLDVRGGERVVAQWELRRTWIGATGRDRVTLGRWHASSRTQGTPSTRSIGGSEQLGGSELSFEGASERHWLSGSELRLGGASELRWLGASERRFGGASERRWLGASDRRLRGASEKRLRGASEKRLGGASEKQFGQASEARLDLPKK